MPKCAFVTYNNIGWNRERGNGWYEVGENHALALHDERWLLELSRIKTPDFPREKFRLFAINFLWLNLEPHLQTLDAAVIYIGDDGYGEFLKLVEESKFPSKKLIFASCKCKLNEKRQAIKSIFPDAILFTGESCGGNDLMLSLLNEFLEKGRLPEQEALII